MLTRFRIEVEEATVAECVSALATYEHALVAFEAQRFEAQWPAELNPDRNVIEGPSSYAVWDMPFEDREFFVDELGLKITEEVIEYDESIPGYRGRRVVRLERVDMRNPHFIPLTVLEGTTLEAAKRIAGDPL